MSKYQFDCSWICTKDGELIEGENYQFKEGSVLEDVIFLKYYLHNGFWYFSFKILDTDEKFDVGFNPEFSNVAYMGMWRLFDKNTYDVQKHKLAWAQIKDTLDDSDIPTIDFNEILKSETICKMEYKFKKIVLEDETKEVRCPICIQVVVMAEDIDGNVKPCPHLLFVNTDAGLNRVTNKFLEYLKEKHQVVDIDVSHELNFNLIDDERITLIGHPPSFDLGVYYGFMP